MMGSMQNPFEKLLSGLLPHKGSESFVGIDIGGSSVKIVQLHKKSQKAVLDTYGEIALGPLVGLEIGQVANPPVETLVKAIQELLVEAKVTSRDMVIALPLTSTLLTVIEMPDLGEAKLKEMIPIEARKYIPTAVSEVAFSHWIIPKLIHGYEDPDRAEPVGKATPKVDVLLAAVHNDVLERYNDIAKRLGATTATFEIEVFSTIRSTLGHDAAPAMILDIGAANTKVAIVEDGIVRSSHLINAGSQDVTIALAQAKNISNIEAEELKHEFGLTGSPADPALAEVTRLAVEKIFSQANRVLLRYQHEKRVTISKVILTGGGVLMKGLFALAQGSFETPVQYGNAFNKIETAPEVAALVKDSGPEFAVAIGLALRKF